nr:immunoglobulin heavy chain junction region [Mus musculus]
CARIEVRLPRAYYAMDYW